LETETLETETLETDELAVEDRPSMPEPQDNQIVIINNITPPEDRDPLRAVSLYGDVTESKAADIVSGLLYLESTSKQEVLVDPDDPDSEIETTHKPVKFFISTHGGNAMDMFAIYDTMKMIQNTCEVETVGMGKVMSAGVPLLAGGTKGQRKIGRNCRVMIHNVSAGNYGSIFTLENELEEIRWIQDRYIECLSKDTFLTKSKIKKMLNRQTDV